MNPSPRLFRKSQNQQQSSQSSHCGGDSQNLEEEEEYKEILLASKNKEKNLQNSVEISFQILKNRILEMENEQVKIYFNRVKDLYYTLEKITN